MERPVLGPIDPVTGRPLYLPHDVVSDTEATGLEPIPPRTPEEAERNAGVADETAHFLYEKARYSKAECTAEDAAYLKKLG